MEINLTTKGSNAIISLKGELDFNTCREFEEILEQAIEKADPIIVVDLTSVEHIDSMGLGCLTRLWKHAADKKTDLHIAGANKNVSGLINLVNLDKRMKMFSKVDEALS